MAPISLPFQARLLVVLGLISSVSAGTGDHRYKKGEHVELWVNKVGEP